jgi:hypothetical protein
MKLSNWKQWQTTTLGLVFILTALVSVFFNHSWTEAMYGIAAGLMLIFAPDKILESIKNLLKIVILFVFTSCMNEKKMAAYCAEKFPVKDSIILTETIDTQYRWIKGDTIKVPFKVNDSTHYGIGICPPIKVADVRKSKEKVVYQENTAKIKQKDLVIDSLYQKITNLELNNSSLIKQIEDKNAQIKKLQSFKFWVILIIILIIGGKILINKLW